MCLFVLVGGGGGDYSGELNTEKSFKANTHTHTHTHTASCRVGE